MSIGHCIFQAEEILLAIKSESTVAAKHLWEIEHYSFIIWNLSGQLVVGLFCLDWYCSPPLLPSERVSQDPAGQKGNGPND